MQLAQLPFDCGGQFQADPLGCLQQIAQHGDVVAFERYRVPHLFLNHPELIHAVLVEHAEHFQRTEHTRQSLGYFLGNGLLVSDGAFHRAQRQRLQPAFYHQQIARYAAQMIAHVQRALDALPHDTPHDVHKAMMKLTLGIVTDALFGVDAQEILGPIEKLSQAIAEAQRSEWSLYSLIPGCARTRYVPLWNVRYSIRWMIERRRAAQQPRDDLLDLLLRATEGDAPAMTDEQVRDEIITLFVAGHESSSMTLTWALLMLAQHPDVQAQLRAEAQRVFSDRGPRPEDYPQLRYAQMVVRETTRLFPTAWILFLRLASADLDLHGLPVRQGTHVMISPFILHRDPRFYPQPERFLPERFAEGAEAARPRATYLAFGNGPRICIGQHFAMQEATFALASLAQRFHILPDPDYQLALVPDTVLRPHNPVLLRFVPV